MRAVIFPFYGQQDKERKLFRLTSDSSVRMLAFIAGQLVRCGWQVTTVCPYSSYCIDAIPHLRSLVFVKMPLDNLHRRLHWDPENLAKIFSDTDIAILGHELLAFPLRCVVPRIKIVSECGLTPETAWPETAPLFDLAWKASDLVYSFSEGVSECVQAKKKTIWKACFDEQNIRPSNIKNIDVLFNQRASATGYSNHLAFVTQMARTNFRILMTDPTGYAKKIGDAPSQWLPDRPLSEIEYYGVLGQSKVVVGLTTNSYGGSSFREAIASGAVPVALRGPGYTELLGDDWPFLIESFDELRSMIESAMQSTVPEWLRVRALEYSYQAAWPKIKSDLESI